MILWVLTNVYSLVTTIKIENICIISPKSFLIILYSKYILPNSSPWPNGCFCVPINFLSRLSSEIIVWTHPVCSLLCLSFSIMLFQCIHAVELSNVITFLLLDSIPLDGYTLVFIEVPVDTYLSCFQFWAILYEAAGHICAWDCVRTYIFISRAVKTV